MVDHNIETGQIVKDRISGFTGVVTTFGNHISGCDRIGVSPVGEETTDRRGEEEFLFPGQLEIVEEETEFTDENVEEESSVELGEKVRDRVSGFEGHAVVINHKLWNCPVVAVESSGDGDTEWFDHIRLRTLEGEGVVGEFEEYEEEHETGSVADSPSRFSVKDYSSLSSSS